MATRAECDQFYRWAGFTQGFDPDIDRNEVLQRAARLPEALAGHIRRAAAVAALTDPDAYFDVSEYATTTQAVEAVAGDPARAGQLVLALMPSSWAGDAAAAQRPYALRVLRPNGHCHRRLAEPTAGYAAVPLRFAACDEALRRCLYDCVSNLPQERTAVLLRRGDGWILFPRALHEVFVDIGDLDDGGGGGRGWLDWLLG